MRKRLPASLPCVFGGALGREGKIARESRAFSGGPAGQATTEYILLLFAVVGFYVIVAQGLSQLGLSSKLTTLMTGSFAKAYQYGKADAKGYDDGEPENHALIRDNPGKNFRIFLNTKEN